MGQTTATIGTFSDLELSGGSLVEATVAVTIDCTKLFSTAVVVATVCKLI